MAEDNKPEDYLEDPLEALLDQESDEEFGLPEFREHLADHLKPAKLKDWTAADFASIYVRFRPHLERHAKRFLVNPSQREEVVQDAFLYLMTTLPELDSEVGVLKFLKWKTRLLALDVIRANSRASFAPIDEIPEPAAKVDDFNQELERADDAAIVAMAMAKLQPRHREALLATMYEEKSQEVVAAQMGLSENALRQLIFRARAAFKKALIGEAETAGKSMSEILSIAARKAAAESGKFIGAAGAFLLVLAISIGVLPNIGGLTPESNLAETAPAISEPATSEGATSEGATPESTASETGSETQEQTTDSAGSSPADSSLASDTGSGVDAGSETAELVTETVSDSGQNGTLVAAPALVVTPATEEPNPEVTQLPTFTDEDFAQILATNVSQAGFYSASTAAAYGDLFQGQSIEVFGGTGISAFVYVNPSSLQLENAMFQLWVDGTRYYAVARFSSVSKNGLVLGYTGSNFYVADEAGRVFDDSPLANATAQVSLTVDAQGYPIRASIKVSN
jgi:RNA polymerase sigma-70 factor (ECF subfamily)